jgi:hypothetical protein
VLQLYPAQAHTCCDESLHFRVSGVQSSHQWGAEVECEELVAADGGEGSADGQVMQAGRQDVKLLTKISWSKQKNCGGEAVWQFFKYLQHRQCASILGRATGFDTWG